MEKTIPVTLDAGADNERVITFRTRNLYEFSLDELFKVIGVEDKSKIEKWMRENATFVHSNASEYLFWMPDDLEAYEENFKDSPAMLKDILYAAFSNAVSMSETTEDPGYLLIYIE